jgi:hypothetical protein
MLIRTNRMTAFRAINTIDVRVIKSESLKNTLNVGQHRIVMMMMMMMMPIVMMVVARIVVVRIIIVMLRGNRTHANWCQRECDQKTICQFHKL